MKNLLLLISFFTLTANAQTVALQTFATGFTSPVEIAHPVGDSRLFVVQQAGIIKVVSATGVVNATPFLTLTTATIVSGGERGLLGLTFHPNYATNGYFYLNYTRAGDGATVIARYTVSADPNVANATSGTVLLVIAQPASNHNGGTIKFGPDNYLYIGMGDGGFGGDPDNRSQNINDNLGKMLRLDVDAAFPYSNPSTNPYVGSAGNDEIWAIGLRNPWKFSFNRLNGDLWIADVGQSNAEEINKTPSPLPNTGLNFGWRCYEGNTVYNLTPTGNCPAYVSTVAPITQYGHGASRCSITGGYFYTGSMYPNFANKYFFADYCTAEIGYIVGTNSTITWALNPTGSITTFGEDRNGELYAAVGGTIYRIIDSSLGLNDFNKNGLSFYPNPAKTEIFIKNSTGATLSNVKIFDLTGKLISATAIENNNIPSVNIADLSSGMYLISVEDVTGNQFQSKLVVE